MPAKKYYKSPDTIHFAKKNNPGFPSCGRPPVDSANLKTTSHPPDVTCDSCKRSLAYKNAYKKWEIKALNEAIA